VASAHQPGYVDELEPGTGWVIFAGVILLLVGCFNIIDGVAAIAGASYIHNQLQFANLHAWGWFFMIWGIVQACAAFGIWAGLSWARVIGIVSAFGSIIAQLAWVRSNPVWAICAVAVDVLVIYALVVYGRGPEDDLDAA
jgi:hypothetical protein